MKTIALLSGGKDSLLSILVALRYGHEPVVIANMAPSARPGPQLSGPDEVVHEVDSYMFQTVGHEVIEHIADCMALPLRRSSVHRGQARDQSLSYAAAPPDDDEVEELFRLLKAVKDEFPEVEAVTTGAILSNYQRNRVENVCKRLHLVSVAYLWQRTAAEVLDMVSELSMTAILVKTASVGLDPRKLLGKTLAEARPVLEAMKARYGSHMAGEGGEFETIVLDCPLYKEKCLSVSNMHVVMVDENEYSPSGHCVLTLNEAPKTADMKKADELVLRRLCERTVNRGGLAYPGDAMAALPALSNLSKYVETSAEPDSLTGLCANHEDFFVYLTTICGELSVHSVGCPMTRVEDARAALCAARKALQDSGECVLLSVMVQSRATQRAVCGAYEECFSDAVNPPVRAFQHAEEPESSSWVIYALRALDGGARDIRVLHAQSISCWAAGVPGSSFSQAVTWSTGAPSTRVVLCTGVLGLVPVTGALADEDSLVSCAEDGSSRLQCLPPSRDNHHTGRLAAQFAFAYANASAYIGALLTSRSDESPATGLPSHQFTRLRVSLASADDVTVVPVLWAWCTGGCSLQSLASAQISVVDSLPDNAAVALDIIYAESTHDGTEEDE